MLESIPTLNKIITKIVDEKCEILSEKVKKELVRSLVTQIYKHKVWDIK